MARLSPEDRLEISRRLRPVAPPRAVENVLAPGQLETVLDLIRRHGPWELIIKHHFSSLEELVATTSGRGPDAGAGHRAASRARHAASLANLAGGAPCGRVLDRSKVCNTSGP